MLIVDDNETNCRLMEELTRGWEMQPTAVAGGREALDQLAQASQSCQPYQLVLLDARMPEMDGLTLAAEIRRRSELSSLPLILLTSSDSSAELSRVRELNIGAHLLKPIQHDDLLSSIQRVLSAEVPQEASLRAESSSGVRDPVDGPSLNILLAEDNEFNVQLLVQVLSRQGHSVRVAATGTQVLDLLRQASAEPGIAVSRFDLLLLDIHMPELDGLQVIRRIRAQELLAGGHLPVIALTARSRQSDRDECLATGMDDFLTKPVDLQALRQAIARLTRPRMKVEDLLDAQVLWNSCGGDEPLLDILRRSFCEALPQHWKAIETAFAQRQSALLREAAHKFHGTVATFSSRVAKLVSQLEDEAASGRLDACEPLVKQLSALTTQLAEEVEGVTMDGLRRSLANFTAENQNHELAATATTEG